LNRDKPRYGRISQLCNVAALARKRVALIGMGSMGQPIATQLARHGVGTNSPGRIRLIDGDRVEERNLIGTEYREEHLGTPKAAAAASIIHEINSDVIVSYWEKVVDTQAIPSIVEMTGQTDLLGLFADSFDVMLSIAERCAGICPQVMAVFGPNVDYAEVAFSVPGQTPPISVTMGRRKRQVIGAPIAFGCDTAFVASFVAGLCLELLLDDKDRSSLIPCYADAPLFLLGLRKAWVFKNQPHEITRIVACVHVGENTKESKS
jgi:hypothetical protein